MGDQQRGTRVYVGNLNDTVKKEEIEDEFNKYGKLNSVWVALNPPGFAFVEFSSKEDAQTACDSLNGQECLGSTLKVEISRPRRQGPRGGGRFGGGGGGGRFGGGRSGGGGGGGFNRGGPRRFGDSGSGGFGNRSGGGYNRRDDGFGGSGGGFGGGNRGFGGGSGGNYRSRSPQNGGARRF